MVTARFDMRLDERIKTKAEKARALLGLKSLSDYVAKLIDADASRVIAEHAGITLADDAFDRFVNTRYGFDFLCLHNGRTRMFISMKTVAQLPFQKISLR
nr:DUF1778 domain-containing protein [Desulfobulbaceae bacterium]